MLQPCVLPIEERKEGEREQQVLVQRAPAHSCTDSRAWCGYREAGALWVLHEYTPIGKLCSVNR